MSLGLSNKNVRGAVYFIRPAVFVATIFSTKNFTLVIRKIYLILEEFYLNLNLF